jgi:hypothetical protein
MLEVYEAYDKFSSIFQKIQCLIGKADKLLSKYPEIIKERPFSLKKYFGNSKTDHSNNPGLLFI